MNEARYGNGLIVRYKKKFLFAVGKEKFWRNKEGLLVITYTAVGGNLEREETFVESALREAREELGVEVTIKSAINTLFFDFETKEKKFVKLNETINPAIIYNKILPGNDKLAVCTFIAYLKNVPKPSMEVPALLLLKEEQLFEDKSLRTLLEEGAEILEQRPIPRNAIMRPFGTAMILRDLDQKQREFVVKVEE
ncbi:MAG: NUDIX domain-containing protein [Promethearchaeota archaeon]